MDSDDVPLTEVIVVALSIWVNGCQLAKGESDLLVVPLGFERLHQQQQRQQAPCKERRGFALHVNTNIFHQQMCNPGHS